MTYVETRVSLWEALAGRAPGLPAGAGDADQWRAVNERLDPDQARPVLRAGIEVARQVSARGAGYVMLRSPDDDRSARYLRLTPQEWTLAQLMDGSRTVARLVAEFAHIAGRLAPDQVRRVVADLAANRMLDELPGDVFRPLEDVPPQPLPRRVAGAVLAAARGRRMVVTDVDRFVTLLYRAGGRYLFTRGAAAILASVALAGVCLFAVTWWQGGQSLFLAGGSYLAGAVLLLALNIVALACHELGHALATKHVGRRVPAAGLLIYFGLPTVFVDTSDAWMAGRRSRLLVTAAGPATGLMLAGAAQLVAVAVPALGPVAFKLAFAWYLHTLFNLHPFLPLDGYHLLVDWLEIPNLRGRGLAWVRARLRRRPPAWAALDREGRLVALYGLVGVLWLAIAAALVLRIWSDRVSGLITGLWYAGWPGRLLLLAVLTALAAPLLYVAVGWSARTWRRARQRLAERRREADTPRRLAGLRASELGALPEPALAALAARARWVHPETGRQLVFAGASQPAVFVVVDGALQARRLGDPGGTVRHRVGPGGVVGLANALTGRPAALDWHTAGTTLLALPPATVVTVLGPVPGPPPADRAEAEALFDETPALMDLSADERLGLIASGHVAALGPGAPVFLPGPTHAVVVESGVIALPDGTELRRGTLVGPVGEGSPGVVAQARTPVRLWVLPDASQLRLIRPARTTAGTATVPAATQAAPGAGVHPVREYPPLALPPGPPPTDVDSGADGRFERRMWWLLGFLTLLALLVGGSSLVPGPAWAEMPADRALVTAERGRITAVVGGRTVTLAAGERRYVGPGARITVPVAATARLTFTGGAAVLLCPGAVAGVGRLWTEGAGSRRPRGALALERGRVLADTDSTSGAFAPLALTVEGAAGPVTSTGPAWYAADPQGVLVADGEVRLAGTVVTPGPDVLTCGDGVPVAPPGGTASEPPPSSEPATPSDEPSRPSPSPSTSAPPAPTPAPAPATRPAPAIRPPTTRPATTRPTTGATTAPTSAPTSSPTEVPTSPPTPSVPPVEPVPSQTGSSVPVVP